jgi:hypothetical protein
MKIKLCSFLGRRLNIEILHCYIEKALDEHIIDEYYLFNFSRNEDDYSFIEEEYKRLYERYNTRIHTFHYGPNHWKMFYTNIENFIGIDDICIKCDDDILYIDLNGLKHAIEERIKDKYSFVIHSNCINNGVCAYYHKKHFPTFDLDTYPKGGILGKLFEIPEMAYGIHDQFTESLLNNSKIESYYISDVYISSRISINFILLLGSDVPYLKDIESDEYEISSFLPEMLLRPNRIIGNFITSHYSYTLQEKIMFRDNSLYQKYRELSKMKNIMDIRTDNLSIYYSNEIIKDYYIPIRLPIINDTYLYQVKNWKKGKYLVCTDDIDTTLYLNVNYEGNEMKIDTCKSYFDIYPQTNGRYIFQLGIYYVSISNSKGPFKNETALIHNMKNRITPTCSCTTTINFNRV